MVMENTRPVKAIIACVIEDRKLRAPAGGPGNSTPGDTAPSAWSSATSPTATPTALTTHTEGTSQNADRSSSRKRSTETITTTPRDPARNRLVRRSSACCPHGHSPVRSATAYSLLFPQIQRGQRLCGRRQGGLAHRQANWRKGHARHRFPAAADRGSA